MIVIDGSQGEGGGQILRTALSLSMITGKPFSLQNIRAGRKKPGLMRQHLVCVNAAQRISNASVQGAELNSQTLIFQPHKIKAGNYEFDIGSAGSTMLVFQTLLPALLLQEEASTVSIQGGTHNPFAPTADFIAQCFLPSLASIGVEVDFRLERAGFFPIGRGLMKAAIHPWRSRSYFSLLDRGILNEVTAHASGLNLKNGKDIMTRELNTLQSILSCSSTYQERLNGFSQGNTLYVSVKLQNHTQLFTALGEFRKSAESIAQSLAGEVQNYLNSTAAVDVYLADQLLLPLALGKGGKFTAECISEHTRTQAAMIEMFTNNKIVLSSEFIEVTV